jgi:hypothetical protein
MWEIDIMLDTSILNSCNTMMFKLLNTGILASCLWKMTATVFLHAHLQVVYYNCVNFHKNSISSLVGVALTRYMPPFRESISWIISPFKFWTTTIFLHAHLQVVYYKCVKFHNNPISGLGGVALTRYMDGRMDGRTDGQGDSYIPPNLCLWGVK